MSAGNKYWDALEKAVLNDSNVSTPWCGPGISYSANAVRLMNRAFEIYYDAKTNIQKMDDGPGRTEMMNELEKSAKDGWGFGVSDLEEAFDHLVENNGKWTDKNKKSYFSSQTKCFYKDNMLVESAEGPVNFLNSVDEKMKTFVSAVQEFQIGLDRLAALKALEEDGPGKDWREINKILKDLKDKNEKIKKVLWFVNTAGGKVNVKWVKKLGDSTSPGTAVSGSISKGFSALSEFAEAAEFYDKCLDAGIPRDSAIALIAMRKALSYVPILGSMYAEMVTGIPQLMTWFKALQHDYYQRIDQETRVY